LKAIVVFNYFIINSAEKFRRPNPLELKKILSLFPLNYHKTILDFERINAVSYLLLLTTLLICKSE